MKRILLLSLPLLPLLLVAETSPVTLSGSAAGTVAPGGTASIDLSIATASGAQTAGVQFEVSVPAAITGITASAGSQATAAGKQIYCTPFKSGAMRCLLVGMNMTPITSGQLAKIDATIDKSTTTTSAQVSFASGAAVDPAGAPLGVAVSPVMLALGPGPCDLTADGKIDGADLASFAFQVLGVNACGNADLNKDSKCDLSDLSVLVEAGTKGSCRVP